MMTYEEKLPVIVVTGYDDPPELEEVETLPPERTLEDAKAAATTAGYRVIDVGEGGNCETTEAWNGEPNHIVTVLPD